MPPVVLDGAITKQKRKPKPKPKPKAEAALVKVGRTKPASELAIYDVVIRYFYQYRRFTQEQVYQAMESIFHLGASRDQYSGYLERLDIKVTVNEHEWKSIYPYVHALRARGKEAALRFNGFYMEPGKVKRRLSRAIGPGLQSLLKREVESILSRFPNEDAYAIGKFEVFRPGTPQKLIPMPTKLLERVPIARSTIPLLGICEAHLPPFQGNANKCEDLGRIANSKYFKHLRRLLYRMSNALMDYAEADELLDIVMESGFRPALKDLLAIRSLITFTASCIFLIPLLVIRNDRELLDHIFNAQTSIRIDWYKMLAAVQGKKTFEGEWHVTATEAAILLGSAILAADTDSASLIPLFSLEDPQDVDRIFKYIYSVGPCDFAVQVLDSDQAVGGIIEVLDELGQRNYICLSLLLALVTRNEKVVRTVLPAIRPRLRAPVALQAQDQDAILFSEFGVSFTILEFTHLVEFAGAARWYTFSDESTGAGASLEQTTSLICAEILFILYFSKENLAQDRMLSALGLCFPQISDLIATRTFDLSFRPHRQITGSLFSLLEADPEYQIRKADWAQRLTELGLKATSGLTNLYWVELLKNLAEGESTAFNAMLLQGPSPKYKYGGSFPRTDASILGYGPLYVLRDTQIIARQGNGADTKLGNFARIHHREHVGPPTSGTHAFLNPNQPALVFLRHPRYNTAHQETSGIDLISYLDSVYIGRCVKVYRDVDVCLPVIKKLVESGAALEKVYHGQNSPVTAMHYAALIGNSNLLKYFLGLGQEIKDQVTRPDIRVPSPLKYAILSENLECVKTLVENGADVNEPPNIRGQSSHLLHDRFWFGSGTPLHFAVRGGSIGIVKYLLEQGASTKVIAQRWKYAEVLDPVSEAVYLRRRDIVALFLLYDIHSQSVALEAAKLFRVEDLEQYIREFQSDDKLSASSLMGMEILDNRIKEMED
ncbi:hypothetical protein ABW19_dt0205103 [Dactylella cylindrospora]|nr:hypothetical protein ABW19_dt0205103 [Dactylella cylindrospora]